MAFKNVDEFTKDASTQNAIIRLKSAGNANFNGENGINVRAQLDELSNTNVEEVIWNKGDKFVIPSADILEKSLFVSKFGNNSVPGIVVKLENSDASKVLYFSTLRKSVQPYGDNLTPIGSAVHSDTPFYNDVMRQPTMGKIFDLLVANAGKTVECEKVQTVQTARFSGSGDARVISGTRNALVPFFTCN